MDRATKLDPPVCLSLLLLLLLHHTGGGGAPGERERELCKIFTRYFLYFHYVFSSPHLLVALVRFVVDTSSSAVLLPHHTSPHSKNHRSRACSYHQQ
uniref:Secreted protein n=1 Tax=Anopheles darlingi TaxID=43151 RepID=A0A2M4DJX5_ANODA